MVGIDGRYVLKSFKNTGNGPPDGFQYYDEPSNAVTTCRGAACTVKIRVGLTAGGSTTYTLTADSARERTCVGTATGQAECFVNKRLVSTRQRFTARAVTVRNAGDRRVAGRLEVYVATTTNCTGTAD